jgi:hypothetical protein
VRVVVRPVTAAGLPAHGYSVVREHDDGVLCTDGPSPVAVDANIRFCGSSATNTVACWKSAVPSTVLCLRDPRTHTLARISYQLRFAPTPAPAHPVPQALVLDDGTRCLVRDGGAWNLVAGHPSWVGWYYCPGAADVYGPLGGIGIDQTTRNWTVRTVTFPAGKAPVVAMHSVETAYYVGTA